MLEIMKRLVLIVPIILTGLISFGQQDAQFTQYMDNKLYVNPAYAGSRGMMNMTSIHREQWVGMDGAPRSTNFSLHSPLKHESLGLGLTVVNDKVGPINQTMIYGDFSYTLKFKKRIGKLSFGLKAGVNVINSRTNELTTTQVNDPSLLGASRTIVNPNFGTGVYYHTPKWFLGVSTPKILEGTYPGSERKLEKRHYFIIAGGVFDVHENWKLRPTSQVKFTEGAPVSVDLSLAVIYNEKLWLGLTHRFGDSFGGSVQFQIFPQFKAGLAYDFNTTALTSYNVGSFEVLLSYDFVFKKEGIRSPRYF
jgi:type IX secretion system PorP/SprF family membrane protein